MRIEIEKELNGMTLLELIGHISYLISCHGADAKIVWDKPFKIDLEIDDE